jgi:hypothetical protein
MMSRFGGRSVVREMKRREFVRDQQRNGGWESAAAEIAGDSLQPQRSRPRDGERSVCCRASCRLMSASKFALSSELATHGAFEPSDAASVRTVLRNIARMGGWQIEQPASSVPEVNSASDPLVPSPPGLTAAHAVPKPDKPVVENPPDLKARIERQRVRPGSAQRDPHLHLSIPPFSPGKQSQSLTRAQRIEETDDEKTARIRERDSER